MDSGMKLTAMDATDTKTQQIRHLCDPSPMDDIPRGHTQVNHAIISPLCLADVVDHSAHFRSYFRAVLSPKLTPSRCRVNGLNLQEPRPVCTKAIPSVAWTHRITKRSNKHGVNHSSLPCSLSHILYSLSQPYTIYFEPYSLRLIAPHRFL